MAVLRIPRTSLAILALLIILYYTPVGFAEGPSQEWSFQFNSPISSASALSNGFIYLGSPDGNLYAVQVVYGRPSWKYNAHAGVLSTPAYGDNTIYFVADDGQFYAVETMWSGLKWKFNVGSNAATSPILYEGEAIFTSGSKAYALDIRKGTELWNRSIGNGIGTGLEEQDYSIYVASTDGNITAMEPYYGGILWQVHVGDKAYAPLAYDGNIYAGTYDGSIVALDQKSGRKAWAFKAGGAVVSRPAGDNGMIYAGSRDGYLYALNATDGGLAWKFKTSGPIQGSPMADNGIVYVGSGDGSLYAVDARTGLSGWSFKADSPVYSTPVKGNGRLYFYSSGGNKSGSTLYSLILPEKFEVSPPSPTPYPSSTAVSTIMASPAPLPSASMASSWCPLPGLMAAIIAGIGIVISTRRRIR